MKDLEHNFFTSNEVMTVQYKFKFNIRKIVKKVCSIWGKVSQIFDKVFIR